MAARNFDAELAALEALREADPATTLAPLRTALTHRTMPIEPGAVGSKPK